jgi:predicted ATPase/class 3 adenylate cyclase
MPSLPTGTVTFLFTDIEGSTTLLQRLGDRRYADILGEHQRLLREAFAKGNGQVVDTQGDALLVAFSRARDALATTVAAQQALTKHAWPDGASLRVRMGLHTGEPVSGTKGYVGLDVHRASRICAAGHGGQILVSQTVKELVALDLPAGVSLRDLGLHRLKDLREPEHLLQVVHADLHTDFPALKSLDLRLNNLPRQLTSFIGREKEMAEVKRLLSTAHLVTMTGSGGAGKTRLALQVAADVADTYPGGVWLAEFAPLADPGLVPKAVASALNVPEQPGRDMAETLVDALRQKALLLVLDNCEHLLAACADLAAALLRACPQVRILATSREGLGVPGEALLRVPSLSLPDSRHLPTSKDLVLYEAVRLFVDRALATAPEFTVTNENAPAVAQVCQRLDGIPLAIELAAARVKVLAVEQIAARLDDRFSLLTGGSRMVLPRHQTLRAAIDWSDNLLLEPERALLRRLSVFAGGWTLEAAESICADESVNAAAILDLLTSLVDKSLVLAETQRGEARYRLLETVRQYGWDTLVVSGEADAARTRHRDWYLALAEQVGPKVRGPEQEFWIERIETELDNFRAALEWSLTEESRTEASVRLSAALWLFWRTRNYYSEGSRWLERALAHDGSAPPSLVRAEALRAAASLARPQGHYERATALGEESVALFRQLGNKLGMARTLITLTAAAASRGDLEKAKNLVAESLQYSRETGDKIEISSALLHSGEVARSRGDYDAARLFYEESLTIIREVGSKSALAAVLHNLAAVELVQGDNRRGEAFLKESFDISQKLKYQGGIAVGFMGFAGLAFAKGQQDRAARLLGATDVLLSTLGLSLDHPDQVQYDGYVDAARTALGDTAFAATWAEGRAMTLEQAIEYALAPGTA